MIGGFLNYLSLERACSPHTVTSYENDLRAFEAYLGKTEIGVELKNADADLVRRWAMELVASGVKATSVNRKLSSLRTFYKYLLKKGVVSVSPVQNVRGPKRSKPLPQFVRESDMERMLCDTEQAGAWQEMREHAVLQLFYETGIRLSELVALDESDVDFGRMTIKVTGKRNKQRIVPIGDGLVESLKRYMDALSEMGVRERRCLQSPSIEGRGEMNLGCDDGRFISLKEDSKAVYRGGAPLFVTDKGARVYPGWVYRLVRKNLSQVVALKKRSPHVLRHTFATAMLNNDAELGAVKELMGHESVSTTQIYTHTTFEELKKAYKQAHPRASINQ